MTIPAETTQLAFVEEATIGVTPTNPPFEVMRFASESIGGDANTLESQEISSDLHVTDSIMGGLTVSGTVEAELVASSLYEKFYASIMGKPTDWGGANGLVDVGSDRTSWTIEKEFTKDDGSRYYHRFVGATVSSMTLTAEPGSPVRVSFEIVSGMPEVYDEIDLPGTPTYTPPSPVRPDAPVMLPHDVSLVFTGLDWTTACVTSLALTIDRQNRGLQCLGTLGDKDAVLGRLRATAPLESYFETNEAAKTFLDRTPFKLDATFADTASTPNTIRFVVGAMKQSANRVPIQGVGTTLAYQVTAEGVEPAADPFLQIIRTGATEVP